MNDQAKNWVWNYRDTVRNLCKKYFPQDPQTVEDIAHNVLVNLSQKDGLDRVGDRSKWIRTVAHRECMNYFRESKRNLVRMEKFFEDPVVGVDEKLSDARLDKEARGSSEDIENETDKPEKIDPVKCWRSFQRYNPKMAAALTRSFFFVTQAFDSIKLDRIFRKEDEQIKKTLAALKDAKRRTDKICGTFTDQAFQKYADSIGTERAWDFNIDIIFQYRIRELIRWVESGNYFSGTTISGIASKRASERVPGLSDEGYDERSIKIFNFRDVMSEGDPEVFYWNSRRILAYVHDDPDPLYVLYRVWNRILRKGREGKYGNRKLLEILLFAFKKTMAAEEDEDWDWDIFDSLTEETNLETLRVMSYQLNKGYSALADFIYRKSVRPPKRKTTPTDEKKLASPSSI